MEPASDEQIAKWMADCPIYTTSERILHGMVARVRAEQARADADVDAAILLGDERLARMQARAEAAEAQVALMRPVVEAAEEYEDTHPSTESHTFACRLVCPAVRAYREATRGA